MKELIDLLELKVDETTRATKGMATSIALEMDVVQTIIEQLQVPRVPRPPSERSAEEMQDVDADPSAPADIEKLPDYWDQRRYLEDKPDKSRCAADLRQALLLTPSKQSEEWNVYDAQELAFAYRELVVGNVSPGAMLHSLETCFPHGKAVEVPQYTVLQLENILRGQDVGSPIWNVALDKLVQRALEVGRGQKG